MVNLNYKNNIADLGSAIRILGDKMNITYESTNINYTNNHGYLDKSPLYSGYFIGE